MDLEAAVRRLIAAAILVVLSTAGCTAVGAGGATTTTKPSVAPTTADLTDADAKLIISMYGDINQAFQRSADDGVRAMITYQHPEDLIDVDFARCVNTILPGATTLPPMKRLHFYPPTSRP